MWYDTYPTHSDPEFAGRVARVSPDLPHYGLASLNITNVTESDRGWYNCKVLFLDRRVVYSTSFVS